ncbi:PepSY-associated TM helix domain-containing protein [Paenibacillus sp. GCM10023248]|uniref:PepSY-associated TM helix domain-containing protein n=1 Tax=unclassified Paenibacillus TaxID=185978 RepID=UPI002378C301|nr:PepSY-associated TM helix domain-containing protein [Paenibacillus sp. MAHUQ-63]MDD9270690.1 PepSY-associated TM helix domain-containing protein [Paenibacillus sp. MAHUQ-63]
MKRTRQLHLWIGMICSVFILIQSVTGLLLSEKWLTGASEEPPQGMMQTMNAGNQAGLAQGPNQNQDQSQGQGTSQGQTQGQMQGQMQGQRPFPGGGAGPGGQAGVTGFIKNLHEGRIGNTNVKWLVDLTAISMIVLTVTGITLSIKTLRAQSMQRKRRRSAAQEA